MITEKELYNWLKPIAKWGDILTFEQGRVLITPTMGGFQLTSEDPELHFAWYVNPGSAPFNYTWTTLKLWRCSRLPPIEISDIAYGDSTRWSCIATYSPPKEETITIPKAEYDKMKRRYEAFKEYIEAI